MSAVPVVVSNFRTPPERYALPLTGAPAPSTTVIASGPVHTLARKSRSGVTPLSVGVATMSVSAPSGAARCRLRRVGPGVLPVVAAEDPPAR